MYLSDEQVASYLEQGYLLLPAVFARQDVELLRRTLSRLFQQDSEQRVMEKDGAVVRSVYGHHLSDEVCARLVRHPGLVEPARQILGAEVYVYQFKINAKVALKGDVWEWHQDYAFWRNEDGLPRAEVVNVVLFVDDVTDINGPLIFLAGSHKEGLLETPADEGVPAGYEDKPDWISNLTADIKYSVDRDRLAALVERYPPAIPKGPAGSLLLFHPNTIHGSAQNMSPHDRRIILASYSHVENLPRSEGERRPEFLVSRDFTPVEVSADAALAG